MQQRIPAYLKITPGDRSCTRRGHPGTADSYQAFLSILSYMGGVDGYCNEMCPVASAKTDLYGIFKFLLKQPICLLSSLRIFIPVRRPDPRDRSSQSCCFF